MNLDPRLLLEARLVLETRLLLEEIRYVYIIYVHRNLSFTK